MRIILFSPVLMLGYLLSIAVGHPLYRFMPDKQAMLRLFVVYYYLAGLLRHCVMNSHPGAPLFLVMTLHLAAVAYFTVRKGRSRALFAAFLGVSTVVDLLAAALTPWVASSSIVWLFYEIVLYLLAYSSFMALPERLRAAGYDFSGDVSEEDSEERSS